MGFQFGGRRWSWFELILLAGVVGWWFSGAESVWRAYGWFVMVAIFLIFRAGKRYELWLLGRRGIELEALAVDVEVDEPPPWSSRHLLGLVGRLWEKTMSYLVYEYEVPELPGRRFVARAKVEGRSDLAMAVGKTIPIEYLPGRPQVSRIRGFSTVSTPVSSSSD